MSFDIHIPDHWRWATIAEVQSSEKRSTITGPFGSSIGKKFFVEHGVPVIRGNNLSLDSTKFKDEGFVFVSEDKAEELRGYKAFKHDLIFTAAGTIGQVGIIPDNTKYECYIISNKQMRARFDTDKVDPMFAYYWFSSPWMVDYIKRHDTGSTIPLINLGVLRSLPMPLPPVVEQVAIRQYLFMIDEKINNNNKINQTLEQMAQALFKSWFVDFEPVKVKMVALEAGGSQEDATLAAMTAISGKDADALAVFEREHPEQYAELKATAELFPSAMQDSELGEIPEEWSVASISDMGKITCGKTPSKKEPEYFGDDIPFIKIPDMHGQLFVLKTNEYLSAAGSNSQLKKLVPANSICVSCIATIGVVSITNEPSHTNQQINSVTPHKSSFLYYIYFCMLGLKDYLHVLGSAGSATLNVNTSTFSGIKIAQPDDKVLDLFHAKCTHLFNEIKSLSVQTESLAQLRDTLLPKLLSGEITLPEAERALSEAENV